MPYEMRKTMAKRRVWGTLKKDVESPDYMIKAINAYKSLCYDPVRESMDALLTKISMLNKSITDPMLTLKDGKDTVSQLEYFESKVYSLQSEIKKDETITEIKGKKNLSNLERWQRKQIEYRKIKEAEE
jgi:hypothetical protein